MRVSIKAELASEQTIFSFLASIQAGMDWGFIVYDEDQGEVLFYPTFQDVVPIPNSSFASVITLANDTPMYVVESSDDEPPPRWYCWREDLVPFLTSPPSVSGPPPDLDETAVKSVLKELTE